MPVPLQQPTPEGIVAVGGPLTAAIVRDAYQSGVFPWPHPGLPLLWFSPDPRAVLDFDDLHVPKSLAKAHRNTTLRFTIDSAFPEVIQACRKTPRPDQESTWITHTMERVYNELHQSGDTHSVEAWDTDNQLVGGLYGVCVDGVFSGESMFHRVDNASKLCVLHLVDHLKSRGLHWIDIETMTPHFAALGAKEIRREVFLERLASERQRGLVLFDRPDSAQSGTGTHADAPENSTETGISAD